MLIFIQKILTFNLGLAVLKSVSVQRINTEMCKSLCHYVEIEHLYFRFFNELYAVLICINNCWVLALFHTI